MPINDTSTAEGLRAEFFAVEEMLVGITGEFSEQQVADAEKRLRDGKQSNEDVSLLGKHLTLLTAQAVVRRLSNTAINRLSPSEAVKILAESELAPQEVQLIGSKLKEVGWISPEEDLKWKKQIESMEKSRDEWRQDVVDLTRYDDEAPRVNNLSPSSIKELLNDPTAQVALKVFAENIQPDQLVALYEDPDFAAKLSLLLAEKGHLKPEEAIKLREELEILVERLKVVESERTQAIRNQSISEQREAELKTQLLDIQKQLGEKMKVDTELRLQLAELKAELESSSQASLEALADREELLNQIAQLKEVIAQNESKNEIPAQDLTTKTETAPTNKPLADEEKPEKKSKATATEIEKLKHKWRLYADTLFGELLPGKPRKPEAMAKLPFSMSHEGLVESQMHFSSGRGERPGLLLPIETQFGGASMCGRVSADELENVIMEMSINDREGLATLAEYLTTHPKERKALYTAITRDLSMAVEVESYYGNSTFHNNSWITRASSLVGNDKDQYKKIRGIFINIDGTQDSLNEVASTLTLIGESQKNSSLVEWSNSLRQFAESPFVQEVKGLAAKAKEVRTGKHTWVDSSRTDKKGEEAEAFYAEVHALGKKTNKQIANAEATLIKLGFALDIANMQASIPKEMQVDIHTQLTDDGISLQGARNINSIMLSLVSRGTNPASFNEKALDDAKWMMTSSLQSGWPPTKMESCVNNLLPEAMTHEQPISLELTKDKPIMLFVGHNGAGKTHSMETLLQQLGMGEVTHTVHFSKLKSPRIANVRGLIGATAHTDRLSSFQREATLLRNVFESLSAKKPGETAVLAIDEVGKGTDSRDAIALMVAASEYCRRRGIYLVMATHHGREFLKVSEKIGLRQHLTVVSPDYKTHQIKEYDGSVDSEGIEVLSQRSKMTEGIYPATAKTLIENAKVIRAAVLSDSKAKLQEVPLKEETDLSKLSILPFVDNESLSDMGYSPNSLGSLSYLAEQTWRGERASTLGKKAFRLFENGFAVQMGRNFPVQARLKRIEIISRIGTNFKDDVARQTMLGQVASVAVLRAGLDYNPNEFESFDKGEGIEDKAKAVIKCLEQSDPLDWYGIYLDDKTSNVINSWNKVVRANSARDTLRRQAIQLATNLDASSHGLSQKLFKFIEIEGAVVEEQFKTQDTRRVELVRQAIAKSVTPSVYSLRKDFNLDDLLALATKFGVRAPTYVSEDWIRDNIVEPIKAGKAGVKEAVGEHIKANVKNLQTQKNLMAEIFPEERMAEAVFVEIEKTRKYEEFRKFCEQMKLVLPQNQEEAKIVYLNFARNNPELALIRGFDFLSAQGRRFYGSYGFEKTMAKLQQFSAYTQMEEILSFRKAVGELVDPAASAEVQKDYYAVLNNEFGGSIDDMRRYNRDAEIEGHDDKIAHLNLSNEEKQRRVNHRRATSDAWSWIGNSARRALYDTADAFQVVDDLGFYFGAANSHTLMNMVEPTISNDGSINIKGGIPMALLTTMPLSSIVPQDFSLNAQENVAVIGGANGNGKSQMLETIPGIMLWSRNTGKVPATEAMLPAEIPFVMSAINAGETSEIKSSWQNEADRIADLIHRYTSAGSPQGGWLFFDEPGAGTSPEDQIGVLLALVGFFAQRGVKVVFTNHNHLMYERLRQTQLASNEPIRFKPYAFLHSDNTQERFTAKIFSPERTSDIRSDGIKVAAQFGVPIEITQLATFVRELMEGKLDADLKTEISSDDVIGMFTFGNDQETLTAIPEQINITDPACERLLEVAMKELSGIALANAQNETPLTSGVVTLLNTLDEQGNTSLDSRIEVVISCYELIDRLTANVSDQISETDQISEEAAQAIASQLINIKIRLKILTNINKARTKL